MPSDTIISVNNVGKKYCKKLETAMIYGFYDTFLAGGKNQDTDLREHEYWALKNITFDLKRGECLGIIGPNGAGKSTLLKLLNGIILPNTGSVDVKGHVCALIELGAGFHPALTGRENIYVQASILGLSRTDTENKLDDIIEFSELKNYIEMPVKFYSSGMHARLGFSIAMHTHPDIILIDEVLAVGDVGFRYKSYNVIAEKMKDAAIVIVSHNMELITRLSDTVMVLDNGEIIYRGEPAAAVSEYHALFEQKPGQNIKPGYELLDFIVHAEEGAINFGEPLVITAKIKCQEEHRDPLFKLNFTTASGNIAGEYNSHNDAREMVLRKGKNEIHIMLSPLYLLPQKYYISFTLIENNLEHIFWCRNIASFEVQGRQKGHQYYQLTSQSFRLDYV